MRKTCSNCHKGFYTGAFIRRMFCTVCKKERLAKQNHESYMRNHESKLLYHKQYRTKNKAKIRKYLRGYYKKNKAKFSSYNKEWQVINRDKVYANNKRWRENNRERYNAIMRASYHRNREHRLKGAAKYRKLNSLAILAKQRERRKR